MARQRRYDEATFRAAVADPAVLTMADLCRALGLVPRGANYETLRQYADELGLPLPQGTRTTSRTPRRSRRSYTDRELLDAIDDPAVGSYRELCEALGLQPRSATYRRLRARAAELGRPLPGSWSRPGPRRGGRSEAPLLERDALGTALATSRSRATLLEKLGLPPTSWSYERLRRSIAAYGMSTAHLRPNVGDANPRRIPTEELLRRGVLRSGRQLKDRLLGELGWPHRCQGCDRSRWKGAPIPLEIDHRNGDRTDNLLTNLRLLCPNCHALTPTYRGRNIGRSRRSEQPSTVTTQEDA
jgi:5-methylcytosine-specific restriction endonuclease McrA